MKNKTFKKTPSITSTKFNTKICNDKMSFQECEMAILRQSVDKANEAKGKRTVNNEDVKKILTIVEDFIKDNKLICYGGTAINNILPKDAQFYNKEVEIPDYDFFSPNALDDSKKLADIYFKAGYTEIEAKAGMHYGTYKVFVNFIPIADITNLVSPIYKSIYKDSITVNGIHYTPPNYLRMSMYLELSRPDGDISRWEKVLKRLNLLNKYYPLESKHCNMIDFQRKYENKMDPGEKVYTITRDTFIREGCVFFGGYASGIYSKLVKTNKHKLQKIPDFDVLSETPEKTAEILKEQLKKENIDIKMKTNTAIGETVPENIEIYIGKDETIALIHKPIACHSYNEVYIHDNKVKIATIDTIMSFYLAFIYADIDLHYDRLLCMATYLFDIQEKNRLKQTGVLKRFTGSCYGKQETLEDMRSEKAHKYKELKTKQKTREYEEWFLKYTPGEKKPVRKQTKKNKESKKPKGFLQIFGL